MKYFKWFFVMLMAFGCGDENEPTTPPHSFELAVRAADVSFLPEIRESGTGFKNRSGTTNDVLDILKEEGCNTIRLRLWHTPASLHSGLEEVTALASEIKAKGFDLWVILHYSDTWADPGTQTKPALWNELSLNDLSDSVYNYTKKVVTLLHPEYIQVGNEINSGLLWPEGNISNPSSFITLLKRGVQAVRDGNASTRVMMHFAGMNNAEWFFNLLKTNTVDYDIIALSYYPRWHTKSLFTVRNTIAQLKTTHNKDVIIAETAYPFTLGWNDWTNNIVGEQDHLIPGYPATEKGQHDFLLALRKMIYDGGGSGLAYWAPEWVAYRGGQATNGSPWENMALFDFEFKALEGIKVFNE
jgi:arabinogalactan endo-1,4-beta-galactosidase